jgi:hypothetical protein
MAHIPCFDHGTYGSGVRNSQASALAESDRSPDTMLTSRVKGRGELFRCYIGSGISESVLELLRK